MEQGNSLFNDNLDDIRYVLDKYKPHIMSISEANYDNNDRIQIPDYNIETNDLGVGHDISRQILLVHNTIEYTWTYDNIDRYLAIIVIKVKLANRQNVTVISHYRQWTLPMTPTDLQYNRQTYRYDRTLQNFAQIIKDNNDIIIVGDDNIDTLKDNNKYNHYNNLN